MLITSAQNVVTKSQGCLKSLPKFKGSLATSESSEFVLN